MCAAKEKGLKRVAVIGAGITGLATADILSRVGFEVAVFERSSEPGGQWLDCYSSASLQNIHTQYHLSSYPWPFEVNLHPTAAQVLEYCRQVVHHLKLDVRLNTEVLAVERLPPAGVAAGSVCSGSSQQQPCRWRLRIAHVSAGAGGRRRDDEQEVNFDYVVACVGSYGGPQKARLQLPGEQAFLAAGGRVLTERSPEVNDPKLAFGGKRVAVVGFGKSALDMVMLARSHGAAGPVQHVFRSARWMLPRLIFGLHYTQLLFIRASTVMVPSWSHPTPTERALHSRTNPLARGVMAGFWAFLGAVLTAAHHFNARSGRGRAAVGLAGDRLSSSSGATGTGAEAAAAVKPAGKDEGRLGAAVVSVVAVAGKAPGCEEAVEKGPPAITTAAERRRRLELVLRPDERLDESLRSAVAVAPDGYVAAVAEGAVEPTRDELAGLVASKGKEAGGAVGGLRLADGSVVPADVVVLSVGSVAARFPFLPEDIRRRMEADADGAQLYRHLLLPGEHSLAFGGHSHCFTHIPAVEAGTLWLAALWRGELQLPPVSEMQAAVESIASWKRAHCLFEPTRLAGTNVRFMQYVDTILLDLQLNPYRCLPNLVAELTGVYGCSHYAGIVQDYLAARATAAARAKRAGLLAPPLLQPLKVAM